LRTIKVDTPERPGSESDAEDSSPDSAASSRQNVVWGEHLKDLRKLERLELLIDMQEPDLLLLTALTALTHLHVGSWPGSNTSCEMWESDDVAQIMQHHLTRLKEVNPHILNKNPWGLLKP
jgi:hypothetical protein